MTIAVAGRQRWPVGVMAAIALGWMAAIAAEVSGHSGALRHDALIEGSVEPGVAMLLFVGAWQLMIAAMMLPSTLPMIRLHATASAAHPEPERVRIAFVASYIMVWTIFGAAAFAADTVIHRFVDATPWVGARPWLIAGALLMTAGAAQFLPLTQSCLRSCRHPYAFLLHRFQPGVREAFRLGTDHGLYCLGCCWALMLVMFAAGVANIAWMAGLTAVMTYAKMGRRGEALLPAVGITLIAWGGLVLLHAAWLPHALAGVD